MIVMQDENREYMLELLGKGSREQERGQFDYREIRIKKGVVPHAEGSAQVDLGSTKVLAGVKLVVGTPMQDKPNEGALATSAELLPLASPEYEMGPPSPEAIELARVVDRGIRAAEVVDMDALFIEKDKVWNIYTDIYILNYDGNLFDASTLAATTALLSARMPRLEGDEVIREGALEKLKTKNIVSSCTFAKLKAKLLLDSNAAEESIMDARVTIANDERVVRAMQKGLSGSISFKDLEQMEDVAFEKSKELRSSIAKALGE